MKPKLIQKGCQNPDPVLYDVFVIVAPPLPSKIELSPERGVKNHTGEFLRFGPSFETVWTPFTCQVGSIFGVRLDQKSTRHSEWVLDTTETPPGAPRDPPGDWGETYHGQRRAGRSGRMWEDIGGS